MRGRHPSGPEYVGRLDGSTTAKHRLQVVLETLAGRCTVQDACARLAIGEARFDQIRQEAMQAAVDRLEARPAGRPPQRPTADPEQVQQLHTQVAELQAQVQAAAVRAEIARVLPHVGASAAPKKTLPPKRRRSRRRR